MDGLLSLSPTLSCRSVLPALSAPPTVYTLESCFLAVPKESTIRGFSGVSLLAIDEAAWVPEALYLSVRPMLAVSGGRLVVLSTPHGTRGFFYEAWRGSEAWERVEVPATSCPRISPAFLAEERRTMGEWFFQQEYCCTFSESEAQLFNRSDIDAAFREEIEPW